ncbi:MAG: transcription elongation factor GreA [Spirochaetes bacterium]|nr:MAG: transcription elongation factor GreA [Spirochaetota bacterium]
MGEVNTAKSKDKLKTIKDLLNEEKWTRATINSYTINNFKELDKIIEKLDDDEVRTEAKRLCDEYLQHTKNSIIALYISGIISLSRQLVDDTNLRILINIFSDNHKWKIVEYLCNRILSFGENKFALRTLADCCRNENEEDKMYEVWERLIKIDYEEADIVKHIAEKKEREDDLEGAIDFYKKAIHRYVNKRLFSNVKDIWHKLIEYCPEDTDFFFHVEGKVAKSISTERASQLLQDLFEYYKEKEDWNKCITILKRILDYDSKNLWARNEIISVYRGKYKSHSQLEEYLKISNLNQSWRNVHDAISDFEKHISFDQGNFVCHRSWGIGRISKIENDEIVIDFARKRGHKMSLKMAVNALNVLPKDHIWVLKVVLTREELREKVKKDIPWTLKTVIKSFDNTADMKKIKSELVPSIISPSEWSSWSAEARKILKTDPTFGNLPDKQDHFVVRETPISFEEKTFNKFKAEKNFFNKYHIMEDFLKHSDPDSEFFGEMFDYFSSFLKAFSNVNEFIISSYLIIRRLIKDYPYLNPDYQYSFLELFRQIDDIEEVFNRIESPDLKRSFLEEVKKNINNWEEIFVQLFPLYSCRYIVDELNEIDRNKLKDLTQKILDNYKDSREALLWLGRNYSKLWFEKLGINYEKVLIGLIHLLEITFREISNKRDVSANRKINKQIQSFLFKDKNLENYIISSGEDSVSRIYTLVEDIRDLDPSKKIELKHKVKERFPTFKFYGKEEKNTLAKGALLVTRKSYEKKRKELKHILEVEVPKNSQELNIALQHGDLRENAEYKAAKERQDMLNSSAAKLKEEIERAQVFDKRDIDTSSISFGTKVYLTNIDSGNKEEYTILGPWESEPSKNIISYLSPLGSELWNHKVGEHLYFVINERKYNYKVEKIEAANL